MLLVTSTIQGITTNFEGINFIRRQDETRRGRPGGAAADDDPKETSAEMKRGNKEEGKQVNEVFTTKYQTDMLVWLEGVQQITAHRLNTCPCADLFKPDLNDPFRDRALCSYGLCLCILMLWFSSHQTSKKLHVDWEDHAKLCETLKRIEDDDDDDDDAEFTLRAERNPANHFKL